MIKDLLTVSGFKYFKVSMVLHNFFSVFNSFEWFEGCKKFTIFEKCIWLLMVC